MLTNKQILITTRASLKGSWGFLILAMLIYMILSGSIENITAFLISRIMFPKMPFHWIFPNEYDINLKYSFFVTLIHIISVAPLGIGYNKIFLDFERGEDDSKQFTTIFWGFKHTFLPSIAACILATIIIILGLILLIIPGIIFLLTYSQMYFILADEKYKQYRPLALSGGFMVGHKKKLFYIELFLAVLFILSILTLGIALLWIFPYASAVHAKFYTEVEKDFLEKNGSIPETYLRKSHRESYTKKIVE